MATNRIYPSIIGPALSGTVNLTSDTLLVQLVSEAYVFAYDHATLADIDAGERVGDPIELVGTRSWTGGTLATDETTQTFPGITGDPVTGWVYALDGASDGDRRLVAHDARAGDTTPILVTPNGGDIVLTLPGGVILSIGGA